MQFGKECNSIQECQLFCKGLIKIHYSAQELQWKCEMNYEKPVPDLE